MEGFWVRLRYLAGRRCCETKMKESELITRVACLLNRGTGSPEDTLYFQDKKHDALVSEFQAFMEMHSSFLGSPKFETIQGPNDHGTDLIMHVGEIRIGF